LLAKQPIITSPPPLFAKKSPKRVPFKGSSLKLEASQNISYKNKSHTPQPSLTQPSWPPQSEPKKAIATVKSRDLPYLSTPKRTKVKNNKATKSASTGKILSTLV
jgi:hypothetical protein